MKSFSQRDNARRKDAQQFRKKSRETRRDGYLTDPKAQPPVTKRFDQGAYQKQGQQDNEARYSSSCQNRNVTRGIQKVKTNMEAQATCSKPALA